MDYEYLGAARAKHKEKDAAEAAQSKRGRTRERANEAGVNHMPDTTFGAAQSDVSAYWRRNVTPDGDCTT